MQQHSRADLHGEFSGTDTGEGVLSGRRLSRWRDLLGVDGRSSETLAATLPFSGAGVTAGAEHELQTAVLGSGADVDLPRTIRTSNYFRNSLRRISAGDTPRSLVADLELFLDRNAEDVWENSWVDFPLERLGESAREVLQQDLLAHKKDPVGPQRSDVGKFIRRRGGREHLRIPVSYLLKVALADALGDVGGHPLARATGRKLMRHFVSDNTSPEISSFYPVPLEEGRGVGRALAGESLIQFLLCQCLAEYANDAFGLAESGQRTLVYSAPHPPVRQQSLNSLVSDAFYRELFLSPCLSGWDHGESKYRYMDLCHQVLSRSQLNAVAKLKEAGIITRNLVVLPNLSTVSLANNGVHISFGSGKLTRLAADRDSGFGPVGEKALGDLAIKIVEHFVPLLVGHYSAAPYRLDFADFHPETVLGFLPHELDYTHLRMLWRRWKKKARLKVCGRPLTPFGPVMTDGLVSRALGLRGDLVPDFRLVNYPVCLLSTERSPALDGRLGNEERLKGDLDDDGVFDRSMSLYLMCKLRQCAVAGFSGFEARHFSLFDSVAGDMKAAADLQLLVTALAFQYILTGRVRHADIPDSPFVESERRQAFFGPAVGISAFYVRHDSANQFLLRTLEMVDGVRASRRYAGCLRVRHRDYQLALLDLLRRDGAALIERLGMEETIRDLRQRLENPQFHSVSSRLTAGILDKAGTDDAMKLSGQQFNLAAERYYRDDLRERHLREALSELRRRVRSLERRATLIDGPLREALRRCFGKAGASGLLDGAEETLCSGRPAPLPWLRRLINLVVLVIQDEMGRRATGREDGRNG